MMAYDEQTWTDGEAGGTPLTAERLNHIEAGVSAQQVGPAGPKGDAGADGAAGATGATGPKGDAGAAGAAGAPTQAEWDALVARVDALENP